MSDKMTDEMQRLHDLIPKIMAPEPSFLINSTVLMSHGSYSNLTDEITRLRAALAAVTEERDYVMAEGLFSADQIRILRAERDAAIAERDRMREALKRIDGMATAICMTADAGYGMSVETVMPIYETARAAIEGVKEP